MADIPVALVRPFDSVTDKEWIQVPAKSIARLNRTTFWPGLKNWPEEQLTLNRSTAIPNYLKGGLI